MSSWDDHQEMIDDQYLMESIEDDQKRADGTKARDETDEDVEKE